MLARQSECKCHALCRASVDSSDCCDEGSGKRGVC